MKCRKIISYLSAYSDGELSENLRHVVDAHLSHCKSCRAKLKEIQGIDALFEDTLPVPPVPEGFARRVMAEAHSRHLLKKSESRRPRLRWSPMQWVTGLSAPMRLAAAVTVLLAFVTGFALEGTMVMDRDGFIQSGQELYGFEWFAPDPPDSISSIYIAMAEQPCETGNVP